jgi:tRNA-dihydrouridine synthase 2
LGTIDFIDHSGALNLRIHPSGTFDHNNLESKRLILQLGTADPENAVLAALKVHQDVAGIDVNCGYI